MGGVQVALGDWVVADVDGVAFVPGSALEDVLAAGTGRESKEAGFFEALNPDPPPWSCWGSMPRWCARADHVSGPGSGGTMRP